MTNNDIELVVYPKLEAVTKIGIFRALQLGDMLCSIPAIRAVKAAYPQAELTLIGLPWQKNFATRFSHYFADFFEFPGWPGLPEREYNSADVVKFLGEMHEQKFDLVIQMQGRGDIANPMCMLFGAKKVAGLRSDGDYCPDKVLFPSMQEEEHEIERFIKLAAAIGAPSQGTHLEFPFFENELEGFTKMAEELKLSVGKYICIHPGARDIRRRWAPENFAFIGDQLAEKGYAIVLTGSGEEKELLERVEGLMQFPAINLVKRCGHVDIGELAALIMNCAALLSNDTGVSHIAVALKVPSVIVFSPYSDIKRWAPLTTTLNIAIPADIASDPTSVLQTLLDLTEKSIAEVATASV